MAGKCFMLGNRHADFGLYDALCDAIKKNIEEYDVTEFLVGNNGGFDRLATRALIDMKKKYPYIRATRVLHYFNRERDRELPKGFDGAFTPDGLENQHP